MFGDMGGVDGPQVAPKREAPAAPEVSRAPVTQAPAGGSNEAARSSLGQGTSTLGPAAGNQAQAQSLSQVPGAGAPGPTIGTTPQLTPSALPLNVSPPGQSPSAAPGTAGLPSFAAPGSEAQDIANLQNYLKSVQPAPAAPAPAPAQSGLAQGVAEKAKVADQAASLVDAGNRYNQLTYGGAETTQGPRQHVPAGRIMGGEIREPAPAMIDRRTGATFNPDPSNRVSRVTGAVTPLAGLASAPANVGKVMSGENATERVDGANSLVKTATDVASPIASRLAATGAQRALARVNPVTAGVQAGVDISNTSTTWSDPKASMTQKIMSSVRSAGSSVNAAAPAAAVTGPFAPLVGGAMKAGGTIVGTGADLLGSFMYGSRWK